MRLLRDAGFASDIYALDTHDDVRHEALDPTTFRDRVPADRDAWILYHFSIGSPLLDFVRALDVPVALDYHNITDAKYFWRWEPRAATTMLEGRRQLADIAPQRALRARRLAIQRAGARSTLGCPRTAVAPILIDFADYDAAPDPTLLARRRRARAIGRYRLARSRPDRAEQVPARHRARVRGLPPRSTIRTRASRSSAARAPASTGGRCTGWPKTSAIADAVTFTDVVSHAELLACYRTADVFLCLSEHEGFNVPVLEAMHFDVPVVAYAAAAVPDTVGDGGLLLTDKDPLIVATAVERLRSDPSLRTSLVEAGRRARRALLDRAHRTAA